MSGLYPLGQRIDFGIYGASRVVWAPVWLGLVKRGVPIISSWIYEAGQGETADLSELWSRVRQEISQCRALILYVDGMDDFPLKGALVEVGMAIAFNKPVFVVLTDVELEPRSMRPVGSWLHYKGVLRCETMQEALYAAGYGETEQRGAVNQQGCSRIETSVATERTDCPSTTKAS
jgi:hypothetical protein